MSPSFKEIKSLSYPNAELDILKEWKEKQVFEKSISSRNEGIPFNFYEGCGASGLDSSAGAGSTLTELQKPTSTPLALLISKDILVPF